MVVFNGGFSSELTFQNVDLSSLWRIDHLPNTTQKKGMGGVDLDACVGTLA